MRLSYFSLDVLLFIVHSTLHEKNNCSHHTYFTRVTPDFSENYPTVNTLSVAIIWVNRRMRNQSGMLLISERSEEILVVQMRQR